MTGGILETLNKAGQSVYGMKITGVNLLRDLSQLFWKLMMCKKLMQKSKGINIDLPRTADWGGQELVFNDPDGNELGFCKAIT